MDNYFQITDNKKYQKVFNGFQTIDNNKISESFSILSGSFLLPYIL